MTCREFIEELETLLSEDLSAERRADADEHLRICPPCVTLMETYQITVRMVRQLPPAETRSGWKPNA
jgi:hypothetical protein